MNAMTMKRRLALITILFFIFTYTSISAANTGNSFWTEATADATHINLSSKDNGFTNESFRTPTAAPTIRLQSSEPDLSIQSVTFDPGDIDACNDSAQLTVVIANTGATHAYKVDVAITLPPGISYNAGTAESGLGANQAAATAAIGAIGDPAISGGTITFYDINDKMSNLAPQIQSNDGSNPDTLVLRFTVQSACYITGIVDCTLYFYDSSDTVQYSRNTSETLTGKFPILTITKTPVNSQVACAADQTWTITVTNIGTGDAQIVRVEDTPGDWIDVRTGQPGDPVDMGGGVYGWEVNNIIANGGMAVFTLVGTLNPDGFPNQADCAAALRQNNVQAVWACGTIGDAIDNDPTTTSDYDCTDSTPVSASTATLEMPNLVVTSITPDVACISDGVFSGTVSVRVTNNGDGASSGTFTVQVTDGKGWTGTGTYDNNITAGGFADVTINTATWAPDCQPCAAPYSFNATVDLNNDICECNETDNTSGSPTPYSPPIPDVTVTDIDFTNVTCTADNISGYVRVQVENIGCGEATNFQVALATDGCLVFTTNQSVAGPLTNGQTASVDFPISGSWANPADCACDFTATVDVTGTICECTGSNNTMTTTYDNPLPNLRVINVVPSFNCIADGVLNGNIAVTVDNNGCGAASNTPVQLTTTGSYSFTNQNVTLAQGGSTTLNFPFIPTADNCDVDFTATIDPGNLVCESSGSDNAMSYNNFTPEIPDLLVQSETLTLQSYLGDKLKTQGSVTLSNAGCGTFTSDISVRFTLFNDAGLGGNQIDQWSETFTSVSINAGATQQFTLTDRVTDYNFCANTSNDLASLQIEVDHNNAVCEFNGLNNSHTAEFSGICPEINIKQGTTDIPDGADYSYDTHDPGTITDVIFDIENTGVGDLSLATPLALGGSDRDQFSIVGQPAALVTNGGTTQFTIRFAPTLPGDKSATLAIQNNDSNENPYDITITGAGTNVAATISDIPNQTTLEDTPTPPIPFTIQDTEYPPDQLGVYGRSQNQDLIPDDNIVINGLYEERTVTITPAPDRSGSTLISIYVSDRFENSVETFWLTVIPVDDSPMISDIPDQNTLEDRATIPTSFTISDPDTEIGSLVLRGISSNPTLIPDVNIVFGSVTGNVSGNESGLDSDTRTVVFKPEENQFGNTTIIISVADSTTSDSDTLVVTVTPVNDPPQFIGPLPPVTLTQGETYGLAYVDLYPLVEDIDDPDSTLIWSVDPHAHLNPILDADSIRITAPTDWMGTDTLCIVVSDTALSDSTDLIVTVQSATSPGPPSNLTATIESEAIKLEWQPSTDPHVHQYHIYRALDQTGFDETDRIASVDHSQNSYLDQNVNQTVTYYYSVSAQNAANQESENNPVATGTIATAIGHVNSKPGQFWLSQNHPNPFNPVTTITFSLPKRIHVHLAVYNMAGQIIQTLVDHSMDTGVHSVQWDAAHVPTGIYFYVIRTMEFSQIRKCILLK